MLGARNPSNVMSEYAKSWMTMIRCARAHATASLKKRRSATAVVGLWG